MELAFRFGSKSYKNTEFLSKFGVFIVAEEGLTRRSLDDGKCINSNNRRLDVKRGFSSAFSYKFTELYEKSLDYLLVPCYTIIVNQFANFVRRK